MRQIEVTQERKIFNDVSRPRKGTHAVRLHKSEAKLIMAIRSIGFGEIEGLKVEKGLPVGYKLARKTCKFD